MTESRKLVVVLASLVVVLAGAVVVLATERNRGSSTTRIGSGHALSVVRDTRPFRGVEIRGAANAIVRVGTKTTVVVRGDDNIVPLVATEVSDGTLVISTPRSFTTKVPLVATITTPSLGALRLAGVGNLAAYGITASRFDGSLDGAGRIELRGTTSSLTLHMAGTGTLDARALTAQDVRADVAGTGTVDVTAVRLLDARVSGTGAVVYHGRPQTVRTHVSGTGTVVGP